MGKNNSKEYIFDASDQILGRLASRVAVVLRGKDSAKFVPYLPDLSREVVVYNTDRVRFTGRKFEDKEYYWHTGYPGGIKMKTLRERMIQDSRQVVRDAVYGMLPKNKLRAKFIRNLRLYRGETAASGR